MIFARLYREDMVSREHTIVVGFAVVSRGGVDHLHDLATRACMRDPLATAYRLYEGTSLSLAEPISLMHVVKTR